MLHPAELRARPRGKSSYYKGNPASTASPQHRFFTPKMALVCAGFTVRAGLPEKYEHISGRILDGLNESNKNKEV